MPNIGLTEWILIFIVALLLFGPSKLPKFGRSIGQFLHELKQSTKGVINEDEK